MKLIGICAFLAAVLIAACALQSPVYAQYAGRSGATSISALLVTDMSNDETGFGVSLTQRSQRGISTASYFDLDSYTEVQVSQLTGASISGFAVYYGLTAGLANAREEGAPDGFMSGIEVLLATSVSSKGLKLDIRAGSLTEGFRPLDWFSDPDVLWAGIGLSLSL